MVLRAERLEICGTSINGNGCLTKMAGFRCAYVIPCGLLSLASF
jgi:hypothetical protein